MDFPELSTEERLSAQEIKGMNTELASLQEQMLNTPDKKERKVLKLRAAELDQRIQVCRDISPIRPRSRSGTPTNGRSPATSPKSRFLRALL